MPSNFALKTVPPNAQSAVVKANLSLCVEHALARKNCISCSAARHDVLKAGHVSSRSLRPECCLLSAADKLGLLQGAQVGLQAMSQTAAHQTACSIIGTDPVVTVALPVGMGTWLDVQQGWYLRSFCLVTQQLQSFSCRTGLLSAL